MVGGRRLGERTEIREEIIMRACDLSMKADKYSNGVEHFLFYESPSPSLEVVFAFARSWSFKDWCSRSTPFGETSIDLTLFPCLRSISTEGIALVNEAFAKRFETILYSTSLQTEVAKAVEEGKKIVFTGHSSGAPIATLSTLWFLNKYTRKCGTISPQCITFGSALVGDRIFPHVLRRENWGRYFINFVTRNDIVPLLMLSPFASIEQDLQIVLDCLNLISTKDKSIQTKANASTSLTTIMVNASCVASHDSLMGGTNLLPTLVANFIELSPYRPFGTFIFCSANDKLIVVENSNAVLQLLFYFCSLNIKEGSQVAYTALNEHMVYESVLKGGANMHDVTFLDHPDETNWASSTLGLTRKAVLRLKAAEELEKLKYLNQERIKKDRIREELRKLQEYQSDCECQKLGCYDSFKLHNEEKDFDANMTRIHLTEMWDDVMEKLKMDQLPDEFEGKKEWIELGTQHRRIVEPLDIANYYRHSKDQDSGTYLEEGRPTMYRFTQRWLEHYERVSFEPISESSFLAEVEDLRIKSSDNSFNVLETRIVRLERQILQWYQTKLLGNDVFLEKSTLSLWWNSLPDQHKSNSCIRELFL